MSELRKEELQNRGGTHDAVPASGLHTCGMQPMRAFGAFHGYVGSLSEVGILTRELYYKSFQCPKCKGTDCRLSLETDPPEGEDPHMIMTCTGCGYSDAHVYWDTLQREWYRGYSLRDERCRWMLPA